MWVHHLGRDYPVEVPDDVESGQMLDITLPAEQFVQVALPGGLKPGDEFTVEYEGQRFEVIVPDGVQEGQIMEIDLRLDEPDELGDSPEKLAPSPLSPDEDESCKPKTFCSRPSTIPDALYKFYFHTKGFNKDKPKNPKPDCKGRCPECPGFDILCVSVADVAAISDKIDQQHAAEARARMQREMPDTISTRTFHTMELDDGTVVDDRVGMERAKRIGGKREARFPRKILRLDTTQGYVDDTTVTRADWKAWSESCPRGSGSTGVKKKMHVEDGYRMVECGDVNMPEYKLGPKA